MHITSGADLPLLGWAGPTGFDPDQLASLAEFGFPDKPYGGVFTSPANRNHSGTAWTRWCRLEHHDRGDTHLTLLRAHPTARVLVVDTDADLTALDLRYGHDLPPPPPGDPAPQARAEAGHHHGIDWRRVAADVDAVHVTTAGLSAGRPGELRLGWDVPTVWFPRVAFTMTGHRRIGPDSRSRRRPAPANPPRVR